jgi:hypothetical protein
MKNWVAIIILSILFAGCQAKHGSDSDTLYDNFKYADDIPEEDQKKAQKYIYDILHNYGKVLDFNGEYKNEILFFRNYETYESSCRLDFEIFKKDRQIYSGSTTYTINIVSKTLDQNSEDVSRLGAISIKIFNVPDYYFFGVDRDPKGRYYSRVKSFHSSVNSLIRTVMRENKKCGIFQIVNQRKKAPTKLVEAF